jgi:ankyrin repeat protein
MLAVAAGGQNVESVRILIEGKADLTVKDPVGNGLLHIAATNNNDLALGYLLSVWPEKDLSVDLMNRNSKGETPYSIAVGLKNDKLTKLLDSYQSKVGDLTQ